jgi:hypothetical protein
MPDAVPVATGILPAYVSALPSSWTEDDVRYISAKQVLTVPEPELRSALLQSYIEWVHPLCPVLDLEEFLTAIARQDGSGGRISLLVLHAVLLAGAAFVDERCLVAAGYGSRLVARKAFFLRARCELPF